MEFIRKGPWTEEEDSTLVNYITVYCEGPWNSVAQCAGMEFVKELIKQAEVVAVLGFGFFHRNLYLEKFPLVDYSYQERYIRFAFCKSDATLVVVAQKIGELVDSSRLLKLFKFERMAIKI
ncbi:unnamed protein product [Camellia sinensis]